MMFWVVATLAAAVAGAFVLGPVWFRRSMVDVEREQINVALHAERSAELAAEQKAGLLDPTGADELGIDLSRQLLADADRPAGKDLATGDSRLLWVVAVLVPALALAVYLPQSALDEVGLAASMAASSANGEEHSAEDVRSLMDKLRERLKASPDDAQGWLLFGRSAFSVQDFPAAVQAFERLRELAPEELAVHVYLVQARYLADGRQVTPRVQEAADRALALNPNESITLEILAMSAFQQARYRESIDLIERALAGGVDPDRATFLRQGLAAARERIGVAGDTGVTQAPPQGAYVDVRVELDPLIAQRFSPETTVFVLARPAGSRMPLAVVRRTVGQLPLVIRLDDSHAMSPAANLSSVSEVEVRARVSPGGSAVPGPEDVEVVAEGIATRGGEQVSLRIGGSAPIADQTESVPVSVERSTGAAPGTDAGTSIRVLVEMTRDLAATAPADMPVFVFAREPGGPPMPLAVARVRVGDLPTLVTLDHSSAMIPGRTIDSVESVEVLARASASGGVTRGSGDLEATSRTFRVEEIEGVVALRIDARVP